MRTPEGDNDFKIEYDVTEYYEKKVDSDSLKNLSSYISMYCNAFIMANAFLMCGNVIDEKNIVAYSRNANADKIIIFRPYKDKLYAVPVGHHRSPEGVFEVRGHFRKYKSSKVVWIDGYFKGTNSDNF